jgi:hypothetical protein
VDGLGSGPVRVRVDDATNVVVIHAVLNSMAVVYGAVETVRRHWAELSEGRRADLLAMVEDQAEHGASLLRDLQDAPATIHLAVDRRGEPPYFVLLRHAVTALEMTRVSALSVQPTAGSLSTGDVTLLDSILERTLTLSEELQGLMRRISTGLSSALDDLGHPSA